MTASWSSQVIDFLASCKRDGMPANRAWDTAMRRFPPRGRDLGEATPRLFSEDGQVAENFVAFFHRVALAACDDVVGPVGSGNGPKLKEFRPEALLDLDLSEPARRVRRAA